MNETVDLYRIKYHTIPSPGLTYYQGSIEVLARSEERARERVLLELNRIGCFPPSRIRITSAEKVWKKRTGW